MNLMPLMRRFSKDIVSKIWIGGFPNVFSKLLHVIHWNEIIYEVVHCHCCLLYLTCVVVSLPFKSLFYEINTFIFYGNSEEANYSTFVSYYNSALSSAASVYFDSSSGQL